MGKNSNLFKQYVNEKNLSPENWRDERGYEVFQFTQKLESGPSGKILVVISDDDVAVNIYAMDYATLSNPVRKDYMYKLLNEINCRYTFNKFTMDDENNITASCSIPFQDNFKPEIVINSIFGVLRSMDDEYPNIMKLMWS